MQGPENLLARIQLEFAISSVNTGIAAAVAQLSVAIPQINFLVLDWYSMIQAISESCGIGVFIGANLRIHRIQRSK